MSWRYMSKSEKQARAEARIGQPIATYFSHSTKKHAPLVRSPKIWTYQVNPNN